MGKITMDKLNLKIIKILQNNAKLSLVKLSEITKTPRTTLAYRIKELEENGIIKGYTILLNPKDFGYKYTAFVLIKVKRGKLTNGKSNQVALVEKFLEETKKYDHMPWIEEAHIITGEYDILLKIRAKSWETITRFLIEYITKHEEVEHTNTILVLTTVHENHKVPLNEVTV